MYIALFPGPVALCQPCWCCLPFGLSAFTGLDWPKRGLGDHCGLSQSTYKEVSANGPVSEIRKVSITTLIVVDKGNHEKVIPGYTFTFCITQPVAKEVKF